MFSTRRHMFTSGRRRGRGGFYGGGHHSRSDPAKYEKAQEMRDNPTLAEARMYQILYSEVVPKYPQHKFYRQSVK